MKTLTVVVLKDDNEKETVKRYYTESEIITKDEHGQDVSTISIFADGWHFDVYEENRYLEVVGTDIRFIPSRDRKTQINWKGGEKFFLTQDEVEIYPFDENGTLLLKVVPRGTRSQTCSFCKLILFDFLDISSPVFDHCCVSLHKLLQEREDKWYGITDIDFTVVDETTGTPTIKVHKLSSYDWKLEFIKLYSPLKNDIIHVRDKKEYSFKPYLGSGENIRDFEVSEIYNYNGTEGAPVLLETMTSMIFKIRPVQKTRAITIMDNTFAAELNSAGQSQKEKLKTLFKRIPSLVLQLDLYAPYVPLVQSRGYGKSKIANEILTETPGISIVFRRDEMNSLNEFPYATAWSDDMIDFIYKAPNDGLPQSHESAANLYTTGRFLLVLRRLIYLYYVQYQRKVNIGKTKVEAIREIGESFIAHSHVWAQEDMQRKNIFNLEKDGPKFFDVLQSIQYLLKGYGNFSSDYEYLIPRSLIFDLHSNERLPFLVFLDEMPTFDDLTPKGKLPLVDVVRKALHLINPHCGLLVVSIGTKCDSWDCLPYLFDDSMAFPARRNFIPPIWTSCNFDTIWKELKVDQIVVNDSLILNRNVLKLWMTMGRPLWSSKQMDFVSVSVIKQLRNGKNDTVEFLISLLLCRINMNISPTSEVARRLVERHLATIWFIDADAKIMKIHYPSEPVLALAARTHLNYVTARTDAFRAMELLVEREILDKSRLSQTVHGHFVLFAIDGAHINVKFNHDNFKYSGNLRSVLDCDTSKYLHSLNFNVSGDSARTGHFYSYFYQDYKVITVTEFLKSLFRTDYEIFINSNISHLPDYLMNGYINATHFANMEEDATGILSDYLKVPNKKFRINRTLLNMGLLRGCGFMMPPNTKGIDFIVPVMLTGGLPPSYIAFRSKSSTSNLHEEIAKMDMCLHLDQCDCPNGTECVLSPGCYRLEDYAKITKSQLMIFMCLEKEDVNTNNEQAEFSMKRNGLDDDQVGTNSKRPKNLISSEEKRIFNRYMIEEAKIRFGVENLPEDATFNPNNVFSIKAASSPDFLLNYPLKKDLAISRMIWSGESRCDNSRTAQKEVICLISHDINNHKHLLDKLTISRIKNMINVPRSIFDTTPDMYLDLVIDSMINGSFSPFPQYNSQLNTNPKVKVDETLPNFSEYPMDRSIESCCNTSNKNGEKM